MLLEAYRVTHIYLIDQVDKASKVGGCGGFPVAQVDQVCFVLQHCDEGPCEACASLHTTHSGVPNLAGDDLSTCSGLTSVIT